MASIAYVAGMVAVIAVFTGAPAWAQLNNEPYSYRSGGGVGMSDAYRQAMMDREITGARPRNLLRGADGSLLTVQERNGQAVVTTRPSTYVLQRAGVGFWSAGDGWTGNGVAVVPPGSGRAPIDAWVAQLDGLRPERE
ncbi:MAG: hypothetical protein ACM31D_03415 [Bacteroidota bacterium]